MNHLLVLLQKECREELLHGILPFWMGKMADIENGGFYGKMDGHNILHTHSGKGGILNARILWTFSSSYRNCPDKVYKEMADRAYDYIIRYFFDNEFGGTYWLLHADGTPAHTKKQIYSQAFFVYALSEYYRAFGNENVLIKAIELFHLIEEYSFDQKHNGYLEAYNRQWNLLEDVRLSEKDANNAKTMNTHLHILEAYTNLYRIWPDKKLEKSLFNLIHLFKEKIIASTGHLILFFDKNWNPNDYIHSYGHDIEASWLLYEAASVCGEPEILKAVEELSLKMANVTVWEGLQNDGSLWYEKNTLTGHIDKDRHWWVQAEAVVGFLYMWKITGKQIWLEYSVATWRYIKQYIIDSTAGEWYWSIVQGIPNQNEDKAGFWKCPYHNSRMCMEVMNMK